MSGRPPSTSSPTARVLWSPTPGIGRSRSNRPGEILKVLSRARRTAAFYGLDHPVVTETVAEAHEIVEQLLTTRQALRLFIQEDTFFAENTVLLEESLQLYPLLLDLRERQIGTIELHAGIEPWEWRHVVELLTLTASDLHRLGGAAAQLERRGVRHITVGPAGPPRDPADLELDPHDAYRAGLRVVNELQFQAARELPVELRKARMVVNSLIDIVTRDRTALLGIAALKSYDEDTLHHSVNVSVLSLLLGLHLDLSRIALTTLGVGALLHDIGKVRVPREVLLKTGPLTTEEQESIRRHTLYGAHLLGNLPGLARLGMVVAFEHHANYNLTGYPQISAKPRPHLLTRIVQVADFYDAATSRRRFYHKPMLPHEAMRFILNKAGTVFDPVLAKLLVLVLGLYPVGSVVELDTGEVAVVLRAVERRPTRPVVRVVRNRTLDPIKAYVVNLEEEPGQEIVRALDPARVGIDPASYL